MQIFQKYIYNFFKDYFFIHGFKKGFEIRAQPAGQVPALGLRPHARARGLGLLEDFIPRFRLVVGQLPLLCRVGFRSSPLVRFQVSGGTTSRHPPSPSPPSPSHRLNYNITSMGDLWSCPVAVAGFLTVAGFS